MGKTSKIEDFRDKMIAIALFLFNLILSEIFTPSGT